MDVKVNSTSVTSGSVFFQAVNTFDDLSWLLCDWMSLHSTHPLKTTYLKKGDLGLESIKSKGRQFFSMFGPQQIGWVAGEPFLMTGIFLQCRPGRCSMDVHAKVFRCLKDASRWKPNLDPKGFFYSSCGDSPTRRSQRQCRLGPTGALSFWEVKSMLWALISHLSSETNISATQGYLEAQRREGKVTRTVSLCLGSLPNPSCHSPPFSRPFCPLYQPLFYDFMILAESLVQMLDHKCWGQTTWVWGLGSAISSSMHP